ncbi:hypothetical protein H0H87_008118 [Tephrocybe sp. NHM501043]|nr:hypothetical protein H0H87_008118 [Tephrocybe sp. NHM501043]
MRSIASRLLKLLPHFPDMPIPLVWITGFALSLITIKNTDPHQFWAEATGWFWTGTGAVVELALVLEEGIARLQNPNLVLEQQPICKAGPHPYWHGLFENSPIDSTSTVYGNNLFTMLFDSYTCEWTPPPIAIQDFGHQYSSYFVKFILPLFLLLMATTNWKLLIERKSSGEVCLGNYRQVPDVSQAEASDTHEHPATRRSVQSVPLPRLLHTMEVLFPQYNDFKHLRLQPEPLNPSHTVTNGIFLQDTEPPPDAPGSHLEDNYATSSISSESTAEDSADSNLVVANGWSTADPDDDDVWPEDMPTMVVHTDASAFYVESANMMLDDNDLPYPQTASTTTPATSSPNSNSKRLSVSSHLLKESSLSATLKVVVLDDDFDTIQTLASSPGSSGIDKQDQLLTEGENTNLNISSHITSSFWNDLPDNPSDQEYGGWIEETTDTEGSDQGDHESDADSEVMIHMPSTEAFEPFESFPDDMDQPPSRRSLRCANSCRGVPLASPVLPLSPGGWESDET